MEERTSRWIWYYGDFELYHSIKLHARRDEFGHNFPPFWRLDDCWHNVRFKKEAELACPEVITVFARGVGNVEIDGKRHAFGTPLSILAGRHTVIVHVLNQSGLPCIYVEGKTFASDESWLVNCYGKEWGNAGSSGAYTEKEDDPQIFKFCCEQIKAVSETERNGGVLYDFGRETFAKLCVKTRGAGVDIFYGETKEEALDTKNSYLRVHAGGNLDFRGKEEAEKPGSQKDGESGCVAEFSARAFRCLYIPDACPQDYELQAFYEYLPLPVRGSFRCSDEKIGKIWEVAAYTFHLNSREFFLDGIKRDRWVWSGDAYQSYQINRYLFADEDICRRTILALRGRDPVEKHINTIMDYSFYWLMSIWDYYEMTGDVSFVRRIYPKMKSLMDFCLERLDENGFAVQREDDWVFVDWADMDKMGAVCAEQMLLAKSLEAAAQCAEAAGEECAVYRTAAGQLKEKIRRFFWDEEKGAFIDSFASGRRNVTRHANIFALLFGFGDAAQREKIIQNVLLNDAVEHIKTPYFKFYELEALCRIGAVDKVTERIKEYWGSMLDAGATSFWEEYTPQAAWEEQLGMYGDKYGKSLCHAWGASPVYLIGRYYMGCGRPRRAIRTLKLRQIQAGFPGLKEAFRLRQAPSRFAFRMGCWRSVQMWMAACWSGRANAMCLKKGRRSNFSD